MMEETGLHTIEEIQRLSRPMSGLATRNPDLQPVSSKVLFGMLLIGTWTLFTCIDAFALQHLSSLSLLPAIVPLLFFLDDAWYPCVLPALVRQGVRR